MNHQSPEIAALRREIELSLEREMKSPSDFDFLSNAIFERTRQYISPTTLKRIWGYIGGADTIRHSTLSIVSKFAGYPDWSSYMAALAERSDVESGFVFGTTVDARKLDTGTCVEVAWHPNRRCLFRHLGECRFVVVESENSKLKVADAFDCLFFVEGEPLYLDNLTREGNTPVSYLCGSKKGLSFVKIRP